MRDISGIELRLVETYDDARDLMAWLGERRPYLGLDTETTGLNAGRDRIRLCQFGDGRAAWALEWRGWRGLCKEIVETYDRPVVLQNCLFDSKFLLRDGVRLPQANVHDTLIMAHVENPARALSLKPLARRHVHPAAAAIGQGMLKQAFKGGGWDWATIPVDHPAYWQYSALDTSLCALLAEELHPRLSPEQRDWYEVELAAIHCLRDAEAAGMLIDPEYCAAASHLLGAELAELQDRIPWEPNSDKQTIEGLLALGVPLTHVTEKGQLSTNRKVLQLHASDFPICGDVAEYRSKHSRAEELGKLLDLRSDEDRVHCNVHPVGAVTGRMSVREPPLQTLPRGRIVRDAFVAGEGNALVIADYQAMEMRVMASEAGEEAMMAEFLAGRDLHDFVATQVYGPGFTKKQRGTAKNAAFAKIYGAGPEQFANTAGVPMAEGEAFLARYDAMFPDVRRWQERTISSVTASADGRRKWGYVGTKAGRRIPLLRDDAYKACNFTIQGSCAEVLKRKIVELANAGLGGYFRLPVHDELIFECPQEIASDVRETVQSVMPDRDTYSVPLTVESNVVARWGENYEGPEYPIYVQTWE